MVANQRLVTTATLLFLMCGRVASAQDNLRTPHETHSDQLEQALVENTAGDQSLLQAVVGLGRDAAGEIHAYLKHPDSKVRSRAIWVLLRIPDAAPDAVVAAIESPHPDLVTQGLRSSRLYLNSPGVSPALVARITAEPLNGSLLHLAREALARAPKGAADRTIARLTPKLVTYLDDQARQPPPFSYGCARATRETLLILGQFAPRGDKNLLRAIRELVESADRRLVRRVRNPGDLDPASPGAIEMMEKERDRALQAAEYALANLGDRAAFARIASALHGRDADLKLVWLLHLRLFRPTRELLKTVRPLLEDEDAIEPVHTSHSPGVMYRRVCDRTVDTLRFWWPELGFKRRVVRHYEVDDLAKAREFLERKIKESGN